MVNSNSYYDRIADDYEDVSLARKHYLASVEKLVVNYINESHSPCLLDVGAGDGHRTKRIMAGISPTVTICALEPSLQMYIRLRAALPEERLLNVSVEVSDLKQEFTHAIALWNVIGHVANLGVFLEAIQRALRPGGFLILDFNSRHNIRAYGIWQVLKNVLWAMIHPRHFLGRIFSLPHGEEGDVVTLYSIREVKQALKYSGYEVLECTYLDYSTGARRLSAWTGQPLLVARSLEGL